MHLPYQKCCVSLLHSYLLIVILLCPKNKCKLFDKCSAGSRAEAKECICVLALTVLCLSAALWTVGAIVKFKNSHSVRQTESGATGEKGGSVCNSGGHTQHSAVTSPRLLHNDCVTTHAEKEEQTCK